MKRSIRGFTFVEVLIAAAIFGMLLGAITAFFSEGTRFLRREAVLLEKDQIIASLVENLRQDVKSYQVNFDTSVNAETFLLALGDNLPLHWSFAGNKAAVQDQCPGCAGRLGFVLQPDPTMPGMFKGTVLITHKEFFPHPGEIVVFYSALR